MTSYGSVPTSIWRPGSPFLRLSPGAQRLWLFLCSQEDIAPTGVIQLACGRWAQAAPGLTRSGVESALAELDLAGYTLTDRDTEEVLVRWRMRDCNVYRNRNLMVRICTLAEQVYSAQIRASLKAELDGQDVPPPALTAAPAATLFDSAAPTPGGGGTSELNEQVIGSTSRGSVVGLTGTTSSRSRAHARGPLPPPAGAFEAFWGLYPRKVGKARARAEFATALGRAGDLNVILAGVIAYRDLPGRKADFTAHPSTWLHQDRWTDEHDTQDGPAALPASRGQQRVDEHQAAKQQWLDRRGQGHAG